MKEQLIHVDFSLTTQITDETTLQFLCVNEYDFDHFGIVNFIGTFLQINVIFSRWTLKRCYTDHEAFPL